MVHIDGKQLLPGFPVLLVSWLFATDYCDGNGYDVQRIQEKQILQQSIDF